MNSIFSFQTSPAQRDADFVNEISVWSEVDNDAEFNSGSLDKTETSSGSPGV